MHRRLSLLAALAGFAPPFTAMAAPPTATPVIRKALLTATLASAKPVARVDIKEVTLAARRDLRRGRSPRTVPPDVR